MSESYAMKLGKFIQTHPSCFHVVEGEAEILKEAGYELLNEADKWNLEPGKGYFATRNGSSLVAFRMPETAEFNGFMCMASHCDSPTFKVKENPEMSAKGLYTKLNVESYGGAIYSAWFDRPLSVAGRVVVKTDGGIKSVNVMVDRDLVMIPNLAIHMNREVNKGYAYKVQKDMLPLLSMGDTKLMDVIAKECGVDRDSIIAGDLFLYNRQAPSVWGANKEFMSSPKLDDVLCGFCSLMGFMESTPSASIPVHVIYDNEEVGSSSRQGACSTFLKDVLERICASMGLTHEDYIAKIASSFMLSGDNGHAMHPNQDDKCDPVNHPVMGGGVLLKFAASQKYTTDALSCAIVKAMAEKAEAKVQVFTNHSDIVGGGTLGNLSQHQIPLLTADIGAAQLAMHSPYETIGASDVDDMVRLIRQTFSSSLKLTADGTYTIC